MGKFAMDDIFGFGHTDGSYLYNIFSDIVQWPNLDHMLKHVSWIAHNSTTFTQHFLSFIFFFSEIK